MLLCSLGLHQWGRLGLGYEKKVALHWVWTRPQEMLYEVQWWRDFICLRSYCGARKSQMQYVSRYEAHGPTKHSS
jgi:hypothetical protein